MLHPWIAPRDEEGGQAQRAQEAHDALIRRQVIHIGFVNLRRDDQERNGVHLLGRRRILDQLHHLGFIDDRALGGREVFANFERALVHLADLAAIFRDVAISILQAFDQAHATAFIGALNRSRIAHKCVGGRDAVDDHLRNEGGARLFHLV